MTDQDEDAGNVWRLANYLTFHMGLAALGFPIRADTVLRSEIHASGHHGAGLRLFNSAELIDEGTAGDIVAGCGSVSFTMSGSTEKVC